LIHLPVILYRIFIFYVYLEGIYWRKSRWKKSYPINKRR